MKKITIKINDWDWINRELDQFLQTQTGIIKSETNLKKNKIEITYEEEKTTIKIIMNYIRLFLSLQKTPILLEFNKHSNNELLEYTITIIDLCCEYCFMGMIEELLEINGIEEVNNDFDFITKENVHINIKYDPTIIDENEIKKIEQKLNYED